jgi:hypothetical protein
LSTPDLSTVNMSLWQTYIKGLVGEVEGVQPTNVLSTGNDLVASLDGPLPGALAQIYSFGNFIPAWKADWVATDNNLLQIYSTWLEAIRPTNVTPTAAQLKQLNKLQATIVKANNDYGTAFKAAYGQWKSDYTDDTGALIPGSPTWQAYRSSGTVAEQLSSAAHELDGPTSEYDTLAEQVYGDGYQQLQEARQVAAAADPDSAQTQLNPSSPLVTQFQMTIAGNAGTMQAPMFQVGSEMFAAYKKWLAAAKKTTQRSPKIAFSSSNYQVDSSQWKFMVNLPIPLEDFFWVGVSAGASHSSLDIRSTQWSASMSYQGGIFYLPMQAPWLNGGLLELYKNFSGWSQDSPFAPPTQLWGPQGILNMYVTGLLIGYAPYINVQVSNWAQSDVKTAWSTNASFGIGPFTLGSLAGASGSSEQFQKSMTNSGFEAFDTSGQPKIVGVTVATPNYSGPAGQ